MIRLFTILILAISINVNAKNRIKTFFKKRDILLQVDSKSKYKIHETINMIKDVIYEFEFSDGCINGYNHTLYEPKSSQYCKSNKQIKKIRLTPVVKPGPSYYQNGIWYIQVNENNSYLELKYSDQVFESI